MARKISKYQNAICAVLNRIRADRPPYQDAGLFSQRSGIAPATISAIENSEITPTLPIIEAWLETCEFPFSDFFRDVDIEAGKPTHGGLSRHFVPGHDRLYAMLTTILKCEANTRRIDGITVNLEEFSKAAQREMDETGEEQSETKQQSEKRAMDAHPPPDTKPAKRRRASSRYSSG